MNAARQLTSRRWVMAMGPRLTTPARYASTNTAHQMSPKDRQQMHKVFAGATMATIGGVAFAVSILYNVLEILPIDLTALGKKS